MNLPEASLDIDINPMAEEEYKVGPHIQHSPVYTLSTPNSLSHLCIVNHTIPLCHCKLYHVHFR